MRRWQNTRELFMKSGGKGKVPKGLRQAQQPVFRRAGVGFGDKGGGAGRGAQTSELRIDPWQHWRTNNEGLICELGDKKQGLPKGRQLRHKSPQSNLVSALTGLLGRVTQARISAPGLTGKRGWAWGGLSEFVTG